MVHACLFLSLRWVQRVLHLRPFDSWVRLHCAVNMNRMKQIREGSTDGLSVHNVQGSGYDEWVVAALGTRLCYKATWEQALSMSRCSSSAITKQATPGKTIFLSNESIAINIKVLLSIEAVDGGWCGRVSWICTTDEGLTSVMEDNYSQHKDVH